MAMTNKSMTADEATASQPPDMFSGALAPTGWWRWANSGLFETAALNEMKEAVAGMQLPVGARWRDAAAGDAAAAIGLVLGTDLRRMDRAKLDLAMTLLVICALEGNDAACVVLSNAIRRSPGAGPHEARIATSWLVRAFGKILLPGADERSARKGGMR